MSAININKNNFLERSTELPINPLLLVFWVDLGVRLAAW